MRSLRLRTRLIVAAASVTLTLIAAAPVAAHEQRDVGAYHFVVGLIGEPVYVGQKSGLEFEVTQGDQPVEGLAEALRAEVINGDDRRDLPLSPRFGQPGWYQSYFFPTVAGPYTFHITGTLPDGSTVDQSFTSAPGGFNEVQDAVAGQFPERLPSTAELAATAKTGADAAGLVPIALGLAAVALIVSLAAVGLALADRSRSRA